MNRNRENKKNTHTSPFTRNIILLEELDCLLKENVNHGLCGSRNLGNTCYMNSSLACLSNCLELTTYFLTKQFINHINKKNRDGTGGRLAEGWYDFLLFYWTSNHRFGTPSEIKNIVGSKERKFLGYNQQDSNEFMTVFLGLLGEDLNSATNKIYREIDEQRECESDIDCAMRFWGLHVERNNSIITDLFHGLFKSSITCPNCKWKNITYEPFNTLSLPIPSIEQKKLMILTRKKKEEIFIYYVPAFSFKNTIKFIIRAYKDIPINKIFKEIKNQKGIKLKNLNYMEVADKECKEIINGNKLFSEGDFIFGYECDILNSNCIMVPVYICLSNDFSAYPRAIYIENGMTFNNLKTKLYFFARKYIFHPFTIFNNQRLEEFESDKEFSYYINGQTNKINKLLNLLEEEYNIIYYKNKQARDFLNDFPYEIKLKKNFSSKENYWIFNGKKNNYDILSNFGINSEDSCIDLLIQKILIQNLCLVIEIKRDSKYCKKNISLDKCIVENLTENIEDEEINEENNNISDITLGDCINLFTHEENLERGNEWYCKKCKMRVTASKKIEIFYLPRLMCICLKRFYKSKKYYGYIKNDDNIYFPLENLDMGKYICGPDKLYSKYDLFAVSQHYGSMGGGHYTAVCKNIDGNWYEYDDSSCTMISNTNICNSAAYVLFYRRKSW